MAVESPATELGTPCPDFLLPGVDGRTYQKGDFQNPHCLLVVFTCNHCPYARALEDRIIALQNAYPQAQLQLVAICSNDAASYPDDSFERLREKWLAKKMPYPLLHDESQDVARRFGAVCTPDFFLFDHDRALRYRGRFDDNWKEPAAVTRQELKDAVDALLAGRLPAAEQRPALGCGIKWRAQK
jgi:peroxiredoxin